jgi:hypothetical protein
VKNTTEFSWSELPYGSSDLKADAASRYSTASADSPDSLLRAESLLCCIIGCKELIPRRHRGQRTSFCPKHGISISTKPTYIYKNAERNFIIARELPKRLSKAENWRLGFETSEDALSWNVFVGLYALNGLSEVFKALTGTAPTAHPELYLWGNRIDFEPSRWNRLCDVRDKLEEGLSITTEPDIILRVPGQAIVLIEAKFGSPNTALAAKKVRSGSVAEFLSRYRCREGAADPLDRKWISEQKGERILEQLCRNAIFAQWLAAEHEQPFVINLVRRRATNVYQQFREHLVPDVVEFYVRTWEELFRLPVVQAEHARHLRSYLKNKTLNLSPAFDWEPSPSRAA